MSSEQNRIEENEKDMIVEPNKAIDDVSSSKPSESDAKAKEETEEGNIELELQQAQEKIKDYWDQIMRLKAEIENNRKRAERELENAHKYALRNFVEALLPIVDSMEMGRT
ncbi:MAG: nucleotide exchange factor GrpE, partial [Gammaproteobacteria bacterium]